MPVPTYDKFIEPILRYLASRPDGSAAKDVHDAAAAVVHVSDLERQELLIETPQSAEQKENSLSVLSAAGQRAREIAEPSSPKAARPSQVERCAQSLR